MKQPKKLTRNQKLLLDKMQYIPDNYLFILENKDEFKFIHKITKQIIIIKK